jgi:Ricin-type beta-trefoil lectin domain-like
MIKFVSRFAGLLLAAVLSTMVIGGVAQAAPSAGVFKHIKNVGNNLCLQPDSPVVSAAVVQQVCDDNNPAQGWEFRQVGNNHYTFLNQQSGLCLALFIGAGNGNPMGLQTCRPVSGEEFNTNTSLPNVVILESRSGFRDTGFCVDVPGGASTLGLQMQVFQCNQSLAQRWIVGF